MKFVDPYNKNDIKPGDTLCCINYRETIIRYLVKISSIDYIKKILYVHNVDDNSKVWYLHFDTIKIHFTEFEYTKTHYPELFV